MKMYNVILRLSWNHEEITRFPIEAESKEEAETRAREEIYAEAHYIGEGTAKDYTVVP